MALELNPCLFSNMRSASFYNTENVNNIIVPDIKFRILKFQTQDNRWINRRFSNYNQLKRFLLKYQPKNCYQSISLYTIVKPRRFKSEMFIDLDSLDIDNLKHCIGLIKKKGLKIDRLINSGGGFHIFLKDRVRYRKKLINYLKNNGINLDQKVHDRTRVSRIIGSYNSNKNTWSYALSSMKDWEGEQLSVKPLAAMTGNLPRSKYIRQGANLPKLPLFYHYILNKNKKRYVIFKKFSTIHKAKAWCLTVQKKHRVSDLYLINYTNYVGVLSRQSFSPEKLRKILKSRNILRLMRINVALDGEKVVYPVPVPIRKIYSQIKENNVSPYHTFYLNYLGFPIEEGKEPYVMTGRFG